jgi:hypothetical protein
MLRAFFIARKKETWLSQVSMKGFDVEKNNMILCPSILYIITSGIQGGGLGGGSGL